MASITRVINKPCSAKTKMCKFYPMGKCKFGPDCSFAHGREELRGAAGPEVLKLCIDFFATGECRFGRACRFAHSAEHQSRPPPAAQMVRQQTNAPTVEPPQVQQIQRMQRRAKPLTSSSGGVQKTRILSATHYTGAQKNDIMSAMQAHIHDLQAQVELLRARHANDFNRSGSSQDGIYGGGQLSSDISLIGPSSDVLPNRGKTSMSMRSTEAASAISCSDAYNGDSDTEFDGSCGGYRTEGGSRRLRIRNAPWRPGMEARLRLRGSEGSATSTTSGGWGQCRDGIKDMEGTESSAPTDNRVNPLDSDHGLISLPYTKEAPPVTPPAPQSSANDQATVIDTLDGNNWCLAAGGSMESEPSFACNLVVHRTFLRLVPVDDGGSNDGRRISRSESPPRLATWGN